MKFTRDGWGGLVVLATSLLLFGLTLDLKDNPLVPIGPGFYPRIVLGITAALGLWLTIEDLLAQRASARETAPGLKFNYAAVVLHFGVFAIYVAALPNLGFRVSTFLYIAAANALMDPPRGARGWARVLVLAFATAAITYVVFERYLSVLMPRGRWTGF